MVTGSSGAHADTNQRIPKAVAAAIRTSRE
jgi:hypothetical protein